MFHIEPVPYDAFKDDPKAIFSLDSRADTTIYVMLTMTGSLLCIQLSETGPFFRLTSPPIHATFTVAE